ncbi:MAG TPA: hypothetical protein PLP34_06500, partial [Chitinophagaceae bacterium]|nr:hypothetical protein [Chitinophagaceae bacterium]
MRWIISCFILLFWCSVLKAQSFYELQYHMPWQKETIPCKAFLVRNEDGSGFVRVKYKKPGIPQEILLQMSIEDELHMNPDGSVDTTNLFVKTREPESISDQFEEQPFLPVYGFIFEEESQTWEPRLLLSHNPDGSLVVEGQAQLKAENMSFKQLTRSYLSNYFSPDDEFVKNLLEPNTRSISATERGIQLHLLIVAN